MNIGSLYTVKKFFWLLFSTKAVATAAADASAMSTKHISATDLKATADYWSKYYNCEITYFSPDSIIIFLEEEGKYKKVLTSEGKIGWSLFSDHYNDCFEELKAEP